MSPIKIIRIVGLAIAVIAAFAPDVTTYWGLAMVIVGLAGGFMGVSSDERVLYLVFAVALNHVSGSLDAIPAAGSYITDILGNVSTIVNAAAAAVILTMIKERVMD